MLEKGIEYINAKGTSFKMPPSVKVNVAFQLQLEYATNAYCLQALFFLIFSVFSIFKKANLTVFLKT